MSDRAPAANLLLAGAHTAGGGAGHGAQFPVGKPFKAISISGFDVQKAGITLTVRAEPQSNRLVRLRQRRLQQLDRGRDAARGPDRLHAIATTRKMCAKRRMTAEERVH